MSDNEWTHDWQDGVTVGCADVYDAKGEPIRAVLRCNVTTGRVERLNLVADVDDDEPICETRPAPLTVVFDE